MNNNIDCKITEGTCCVSSRPTMKSNISETITALEDCENLIRRIFAETWDEDPPVSSGITICSMDTAIVSVLDKAKVIRESLVMICERVGVDK